MNTRAWKVAAALALALLVSLTSAHASAGQKESGIVVVPVVGRVAGVWVESCPGIVDASLGWVARASLHSRFSVKGSTWGLPFTVTPAHRLADIDISFRSGSGFGTRYATRRLGGEHGVVPAGAVEAVVCLSLGAPTRFTYRAGVGA